MGVAAGESLRAVAARLGRSPASTVSREVRRNASRLGYRAVAAQAQAEARAAAAEDGQAGRERGAARAGYSSSWR